MWFSHSFTTLTILHVAITGREDCTSWEVNNKYYEATLEFEVCNLERDVLKDYQAVIVLHDFYQVSGSYGAVNMARPQLTCSKDLLFPF